MNSAIKNMKIGILGAGHIAGTFAHTIRHTEGALCYAVASRSYEKAKEFAKQYGFEKAYGSYEEMLNDREVELVYIATPHSHHYEHMKLCIRHKKHVLCEKPFTVNAEQAAEIKALAVSEGVFAAEAIWTRYMPSRTIINEILESGAIGKPCTMTASLSYAISHKERLIRPELAGGALLDVGIYCLNFALMHFGKDIDRIETSVQMTDTGVDGQETITVFYRDGRMASLCSGIYGRSDRSGMICGDKGYLVTDNINNPNSIDIYDTDDNLIKHISVPEQINGYEYELSECIRLIEKGALESTSMPLDDTIECLEIMDMIRSKWGLVYPVEMQSGDA